jgi:hypothetical protein
VSKKHSFLERDDIVFESVPKIVISRSQRFYGYD